MELRDLSLLIVDGKSGSMATVLIIEDEAIVLILAEAVLQTASHETLSAGSLPEAKAILESDAKFDIVFTDIALGEEQDAGIAIGKLVENKRPGTPVLYTSGRALTDGLQVLFIERSAFLPKPYTEDHLNAAIAGLVKM